MRQIILDEIKAIGATSIVTTGETHGICEEARNICKELSIPLMVYWLDKKRAAGMYDHRSRAILSDCDHCLLIHDGISKGTRNELKLVKKMQIPHNYIVMAPEQVEMETDLKGLIGIFNAQDQT